MWFVQVLMVDFTWRDYFVCFKWKQAMKKMGQLEKKGKIVRVTGPYKGCNKIWN
jgi:hypothetical protein